MVASREHMLDLQLNDIRTIPDLPVFCKLEQIGRPQQNRHCHICTFASTKNLTTVTAQ